MRQFVKLLVFPFLCTALLGVPVLAAQEEKGVDVSVVVDISGSMKETDPNRIAIDAAKLFIDMMETTGSRAGIVPFSDSLGQVTAMTPMESIGDKDGLKNGVDGLAYGGSTDIGTAVEEGLRILNDAEDVGNQKIMLLFTDGKIDLSDTPGIAPEDVEQAQNASLEKVQATAAQAAQQGTAIYTIGLNANGQVDQALLADMAAQTGGRSYVVDSADSLPGIFNEIFADFVNSNILDMGEYVTDGTNYTEIPVNIPNDSVMEANIILLSTDPLTEVDMVDPDGAPVTVNGNRLIFSQSSQYGMLKMVMPKAGDWVLRIKSVQDCKVHVNLIFNYKVSLVGTAQFESAADGSQVIVVNGHLEKEGAPLEDESLYGQFTATAKVTDAEGNEQSYPLTQNGCSFEGTIPAESMGTYQVALRVDSDTMYRESEVIELSKDNSAPILVQDFPESVEVKGFLGILSKEKIDLNDYFTDPDGDELTFTAETASGLAKADIGKKGVLTVSPSKNGEDELTVTATDPAGLSVSVRVPVKVACTIQGILPLLLILLLLVAAVFLMLKLKAKHDADNAVWYGKIRWMVTKGSGFGSLGHEQVYDMGYERGAVPLNKIVMDPDVAGMDLGKVTLKMNGKTNASIFIRNNSKKCKMFTNFGGSYTVSAELNGEEAVILSGGEEGAEISVKVTYTLSAF